MPTIEFDIFLPFITQLYTLAYIKTRGMKFFTILYHKNILFLYQSVHFHIILVRFYFFKEYIFEETKNPTPIDNEINYFIVYGGGIISFIKMVVSIPIGC